LQNLKKPEAQDAMAQAMQVQVQVQVVNHNNA